MSTLHDLAGRLKTAGASSVTSLDSSHARVRASFGAYARDVRKWRRMRRGYFDELVRRYRFHVEPGASVLEIGVGTGDLLAALDARRAVGVDISAEMLEVARAAHPELELHELAAEDLSSLDGPFDYIVLSDLTVHLYDIQVVFEGLRRLCHSRTRVILNFHSRLWQPVFQALARLGMQHAHDRMNWVTVEDVQNLLELAGFEVLRADASTLVPARVPGLARAANTYLTRLWPAQKAALVNWVVARPLPDPVESKSLTVTVVCPARNEAGHIREIIERVPAMGSKTELIFVEGNSTDDTWARIQEEIRNTSREDISIRAMQQPGRGKGDAVRVGFAAATGDVLMILDADMTVPPEDLPRFLEAVASGKGEFINGCRLVYPMDDQAMRFLNVLGNKFFARLFSYLLDQRIKDTLCGTKVLTADDYARLSKGRSYFGDFDPFGDFDLLFGASKLGLKLVEIPVRYRERVYGDTNISRFRDGWLLIRMSAYAWRRLKLV